MITPNNVVKFEIAQPNLIFELDQETLRRIDEIAAHDCKTRDEVIEEAVDLFFAEHEVGNRLLAYLRRLRKARNKVRFDPIEMWTKRIQRILDGLGEDRRQTEPPGGRAA